MAYPRLTCTIESISVVDPENNGFNKKNVIVSFPKKQSLKIQFRKNTVGKLENYKPGDAK